MCFDMILPDYCGGGVVSRIGNRVFRSSQHNSAEPNRNNSTVIDVISSKFIILLKALRLR
jgi:hypothetical protein